MYMLMKSLFWIFFRDPSGTFEKLMISKCNSFKPKNLQIWMFFKSDMSGYNTTYIGSTVSTVLWW